MITPACDQVPPGPEDALRPPLDCSRVVVAVPQEADEFGPGGDHPVALNRQ